MTEPWEQIQHIIQRFEQDDLVCEEMKKVPVEDDRSVKWRTTLACVQATGALGAKRKFRLETRFEGRLIVSLENPFYDQRGWGNDNLLCAYGPVAGEWHRFVKGEEGFTVQAQALDSTDPAAESKDNTLGFGEIIIWKEPEDTRNKSCWSFLCEPALKGAVASSDEKPWLDSIVVFRLN